MNKKNDNQKGPSISQQALERLADLMGIGLFKINLKTGDISLNPNTTKLTGHDLTDLPNTDHTRDSLIVPEDRELVNNAMHLILSGHSDYYHVEYRMRRRDFSIAGFEEVGFVSDYTENGEPLCVAGMALDMSRLRWAEEKARDMELEVKRLTSGSGEKWLAEENRLLRAANAAAAVVIGGFHQDYNTALIRSLQMIGESVQADYVGLWRNTERDGSMHCYLKYHWATKALTVGIEKDIVYFKYDDLLTDWKDRLAEKSYVICDANGAGSEFLKAYDMKNARHILLIPYYLNGGFWGMMGITRNEDIPFTACEADTLRVGTSIIAFSISRNEILGKINMDREKAMANTLAKGEFLSRMSHEMRTPLNAIIGMTNIALQEKDLKKIINYLKKVDVSSRLMLTVINDVLDMSKIEAGKLEIVMEPFDFTAMLRNAEDIVKVKMDEKEQYFTVNCDESITNMIISDEHRMLQVIVNLLNNAMKFTPRKGNISLTAVQRKIGANRIKLRVEVRDSGIGLSLEQQNKLFNAFEQADGSITRKYGGTGLGLTICKKILNALGGDIWVISKPDQGACFFFELESELGDPTAKLNSPVSEQPADTRGAAIYDWGKYTILFAEDVEINREIVEIALGDTGVKIVSVENGEQAVEKFSGGADQFDLILMDVQMPIMDGLNATRLIRSMDNPKAKEIPIIAMTANAFKEDIDVCKEAGMNEHVAKPIAMDTFFEILAKYFNH